MNYFELPHVIVVFHPGSGGNFIANILNSLINNTLDNLLISNSGDSSFINSNPMLSFGRHSFEDHRFETREKKIQYYLNSINNSNINQRVALLTHNYSNIEIYRQYYPNSKIVYISLESIEEKIISILFQIEKTKFDKLWQHNWEVNTFNQVKARWNHYWYDQLLPILKEKDSVINFINDKYNLENKSILFYFALRYYIQKLNLEPIFKGIADQDYINHHFKYTKVDDKIVGVVDKPIESFIDSNCIKLSFDVIYKGNTKELLNIMSNLLGSEFNKQQTDFISNQVEQFAIKQNQDIVKNPLLFCAELEKSYIEFLGNHGYISKNFTSFIVYDNN